jgi:hypothetical protein
MNHFPDHDPGIEALEYTAFTSEGLRARLYA